MMRSMCTMTKTPVFFYFLLILISAHSFSSSHSYPIIHLEEVKKIITPKNGIKDAGKRKVYLVNDRYYKIWDADYINISNFELALERDFFSDITPLEAIIIDQNNVCRGYVAYACTPYKDFPKYINTPLFPMPKIEMIGKRPANLDKQCDLYKALFEKLISKSQQTALFFSDFVPGNIVYDGMKFLIIDLDAVCPLTEITRLEKLHAVLQFLAEDYVDALKKLR